MTGSRFWLRVAIVVILICGAAGFYLAGFHEVLSFQGIRDQLDPIHRWVQQNTLAAAGIYFLVYALLAGFSIPAAWVLSLLAGALFGHVLGIALALSAASCGATLAFLSSRFVLRDWVQARFGGYLRAINEGIEKDGAFYLFSLRLAPFIPFFAINLCMGLTPMRAWTYVWVSAIGMLPGCLLYVNAGTQLGSLESPRDILSPGFIASFLALGLAPLIFRKLLARRS